MTRGAGSSRVFRDQIGRGGLQGVGEVGQSADGDISAAGLDVHQEAERETRLAGERPQRQALLLAEEARALAERDEDRRSGRSGERMRCSIVSLYTLRVQHYSALTPAGRNR